MLYSPTPLHIPDGFLSLGVSLACWLLAIIGVGIALRKSREVLGERQVPLMGVLAAFIFAAQMLNFTVAGGTSGHLIGGALAAVLLGPWAGILTMTTVVAIQALLFQDGGLLVMGANITNMAIMGFEEESKRMIVLSLNPGSTREDVQDNCGFELLWSDELKDTEPPTKEELDILRNQVDPKAYIIGI